MYFLLILLYLSYFIRRVISAYFFPVGIYVYVSDDALDTVFEAFCLLFESVARVLF